MKKLIYLILVLIQFCFKTNSQSNSFDYLLSKSNLIKTEDINNIILDNNGGYVEKRVYSYLVLNDAGNDLMDLTFFYDKFKKYTDLQIIVSNNEGKKIRTVRMKDFDDFSYISSSTLYSDSRVKTTDIKMKQFPYKVEISYTLKSSNIMYIGTWRPVESLNLDVLKSEYHIEMDSDSKIKYKVSHTGFFEIDSIQNSNNRFTYIFKLNKFYGLKSEPNSILENELPKIYFSHNKIKLDDYEGSLSSFDDFGKFIRLLYKDRSELPDEIKKKVHDLVDGIDSDFEKINILYHYLQANTRYISIQYGIGGWQPYSNEFVGKNKYGDCKALTNFMVSMLKEAGIKAHNVIIYGGKVPRKFVYDFYTNYANHVICAAIIPQDTIWLECTSQTISTGFLGDFTSNREGLLIEDEEIKIVRTPFYSKDQNFEHSKIEYELFSDGSIKGNILSIFSGLNQDKIVDVLDNISQNDINKYLSSFFDNISINFNDIQYLKIDSIIPRLNLNYQFQVKNYSSKTSSKLIFRPNLFSYYNSKILFENKKFDFNLYNDNIVRDTIIINIPVTYKFDRIPENNLISSVFGKINYQYFIENNKMIIIREEHVNKGTFPNTSYNDYVSYINKIIEMDRSKIILSSVN